ncbi:MAG: response regulator [Deltaproteobacteria bacterium]|nr:response regulator [Deltaproteobacteria bacterium]
MNKKQNILTVKDAGKSEIENEQERIELLLVDDESGFVDVMIKRMAKRNIHVTGALSGTEAVQILRKNDFDAAVLDLKMEDINGIEVLKIMKKMVPMMPVIMLTGHGSEDAAKEGLECGAFDYLTKPYDLETLIKTIMKAVRQRR